MINVDDWLCEGALEQVFRAFCDSKLDIVLGGITIFANGFHRYVKPSLSLSALIDFESFKWPLNPVGYFCSRRIYDVVGPFPVGNHTCMDYWFLLRAFAASAKIRRLDILMGVYHIHGENKSQLAIDIASDLGDVLSEYIDQEGGFGLRVYAFLVASSSGVSKFAARSKSKALQYLKSFLRKLSWL